MVLPSNTRHWTNVGSMLVRRLRRRPNIDPTLVRCLVFARIQSLRKWGDSGAIPQLVTPYIVTPHGTGESAWRWPRNINFFIPRWISTWERNESGFRPPLCTYRLNWARRTSWYKHWTRVVITYHAYCCISHHLINLRQHWKPYKLRNSMA